MNLIDIYDTDLRDLENLLMSQVQVGDADELHNGLIVAVKKMRQLEARIDALTKSVDLIRQVLADSQNIQ